MLRGFDLPNSFWLNNEDSNKYITVFAVLSDASPNTGLIRGLDNFGSPEVKNSISLATSVHTTISGHLRNLLIKLWWSIKEDFIYPIHLGKFLLHLRHMYNTDRRLYLFVPVVSGPVVNVCSVYTLTTFVSLDCDFKLLSF